MLRFLICTVLFFTTALYALATGPNDPVKNQTIKGQVTDEKGQPLTGAEVKIEGTDKKAYTDYEGNFELMPPQTNSCTIRVSCIAYMDEKIVVETIHSSPAVTSIKLQKKGKTSR